MQHDPSIRTEDLSLAELHDLINEIDAIEALYSTNKILFYRPLPCGDQKRFFHHQESAVRLVLGSNRSGKTASGTAEGVAHVLGYRPWLAEDDPLRIVRLPGGRPIPVPNIGRVLAQNYRQAINQTIWPKWQEWFPSHMIKRIVRNAQGIPTELYATNGSIVYFMSDDQDDLAFEGAAGHWAHIDEPCGYRKYTGLKRGLVDHGGHLWLTMTPLGAFWLNETVVERAETPGSGVTLFKFSIWDNIIEKGGYLTKEAVNEFLSDLREDELEARLHGNFIQLAGRVYKEWEPREPFWIDPHDIPPSWPRVVVIDPHPRKPVAVCWLAVNPDNQVYVYRELYDRKLKTIADVAKRIHELETDEDGRREPVVTRIIDSSSKDPERTSGTNVKNDFWEHGIRCQLAHKRNAQSGYDKIHEALKKGPYEWDEPMLIVFKCCTTVKSNFMNFAFDDWQSSKQRDLMGEKDAIRKTHDDFIDCIRYYYQAKLDYWSLKAMMRQHEAKEKADELEDMKNKFKIGMPGNHTGYARGRRNG